MLIGKVNLSALSPETDLQELWQLSGRVDALHGYIDRVVTTRKKHKDIYSDVLSPELMEVCYLMGFYDLVKEEGDNDNTL